jgi:hypothetical protein
MKIFYSPSYTIATYSFETTRKSRWMAESLARKPIAGIQLVAPKPASAVALSSVHDPERGRGAHGQPARSRRVAGISLGSGALGKVCSSNGGVMAAAIEALGTSVSGSLSSGLHHARRARGAGFCTFNSLVLAARAALDAGAPAPRSSLISRRIAAAARMSSSTATSGFGRWMSPSTSSTGTSRSGITNLKWFTTAHDTCQRSSENSHGSSVKRRGLTFACTNRGWTHLGAVQSAGWAVALAPQKAMTYHWRWANRPLSVEGEPR